LKANPNHPSAIPARSVGIWLRVSTEDQVRGESPEHHRRRAEAYVEAKGWDVATVYDLGGWSGKSVKDHPECRRMLQDVAAGRVTALVFSKLARFARNTRELLEFRDHFQQYGADMVALDGDLDTSTPAGRMFFTFKAAQAEWEREEIADRVAASVPIRAKLGKPLGGAAPFGYRWQDKKLVVDEAEAPVRRLIYELFLETRRKKTVARLLNERGHRTRNGGQWSDTTVGRLLQDPTAKGLRRANYSRSTNSKKSWTLKPESDWVWHEVPAIVSAEVWQQCNAILAERKRTKKPPGRQPKHLFTGLVYCHCGERLYVRWQGRSYQCWKCRNRIPTADLEGVFQEQLRNLAVEPQAVEEYLTQTDTQIAQKRNLLAAQQAEEARLSAKMDGLLDLFLVQKLSKDDFGARYQPLEAQRNQVRQTLPQLQGELDALTIARASTLQVVAEAQDLHTHWPSLDPDEKRRIVEQLCERITVAAGEIEFELAFRPTHAQPKTATERQHIARGSWPPGAGTWPGTSGGRQRARR
jgi:site-specific DNA recombinase